MVLLKSAYRQVFGNQQCFYPSFQKEDKVYEDKISQVVQLTGKTKDEAEIALYDCDYDPTRAINMLLEGDDQASLLMGCALKFQRVQELLMFTFGYAS